MNISAISKNKSAFGWATLFTVLFLAHGPSAHAQETVKIMCGGSTGANVLQKVKEQIKKETGATIETPINPSDIGFAAVVRGVVDMATGPFEDMIGASERLGLAKQNPEDFQVADSSITKVLLAVHPDNSIKALSKEQLTDILNGKIQSWESISGQAVPLRVVFGKNYLGIIKNVNATYLGGKPSPVAQMVLDKSGIMKAIKADKGVIAFTTGRDKLPDFEPKYLPTEVTYTNKVVMKKNARPAAQKVFDWLKAHPEIYK